MAILAQPSEAPTSSPTPTDKRIRLVIEAEIFQDDEGGPDSLILTNDELACEPTSPARLRGMVAGARAKLDQIERLAREYEARDTLRAIIAEHSLNLYEDDLSDLPELAEIVTCFAYHCKDGRTIVVVPQGQDPIERVNAVADLVNNLQAQEAQA